MTHGETFLIAVEDELAAGSQQTAECETVGRGDTQPAREHVEAGRSAPVMTVPFTKPTAQFIKPDESFGPGRRAAIASQVFAHANAIEYEVNANVRMRFARCLR
jgi:hypothetical protein